MLVLSNPAPKGWAVHSLEGHTATPDADPIPVKCSLIVVPANLMGQVSGRAGAPCPPACGAGHGKCVHLQRGSRLGPHALRISLPLPLHLPSLQWADEIERHVRPGQLKWGRYLPPGAKADDAAAVVAGADAGSGDPDQPTRRSRRMLNAGGTVRARLRRACAGGHALLHLSAKRSALLCGL